MCRCIAGAVGGAIGGAFRAVSWGYNMPGIATLPAYFKAGYERQFIGLLISILVAFVLGMVLTMIVGFEETGADTDNKLTTDAKADTKADAKTDAEEITLGSPVRGEVVNISEVKDEVFASKAMGDGVGICPAEGKIYAPCDGTAETVFETGHAVGITDENGLELLIHIGINTVELNGKGFTPHIEQGAKVKKGDLLVEFDLEEIKKAGYDTTVIYIVTNMDDVSGITTEAGKQVNVAEKVMEVRK